MNHGPFLDPDSTEFYERYVRACASVGIEPASREHMRQFVSAWNVMIKAAIDTTETVPQRTH